MKGFEFSRDGKQFVANCSDKVFDCFSLFFSSPLPSPLSFHSLLGISLPPSVPLFFSLSFPLSTCLSLFFSFPLSLSPSFPLPLLFHSSLSPSPSSPFSPSSPSSTCGPLPGVALCSNVLHSHSPCVGDASIQLFGSQSLSRSPRSRRSSTVENIRFCWRGLCHWW